MKSYVIAKLHFFCKPPCCWELLTQLFFCLILSSDNLGEPLVVPAHFGTQKPRYVSFDTPNLIYLNYADFVALNYPLVKLDSLVEARLDVGPNQGQMRARDSDEFQAPWDATNLIMGIHNVQTLHLTSDTLEVFSFFPLI